MMVEIYADLHIHIGRTETGKPVKISGSKDLTFFNIIDVAVREKGLDMVGIIDCHVPEVQAEIASLVQTGIINELSSGGIEYNGTTILLGCEIEVKDEGYKPVHYLCYFPALEYIQAFTTWISRAMKNIHLSSQRLYRSSRELQQKVKDLEGLFIPAHVFTPYKGIYGSAVHRMEEILDLASIDGVELGLSGDSSMADTIDELIPFTYVTNSDAHSLGKIAREYQQISIDEPGFLGLKRALHRMEGHYISVNYGLSPQLGKYHISVCQKCEKSIAVYHPYCPECGGKVLKGVLHRVQELATYPDPLHPAYRAKYQNQIPLVFFPGIGKKTYEKLLDYYKTEMNILHRVPIPQIEVDFGKQLADLIDKSRKGTIQQQVGGGGTYGKIIL